MANRTRNISSSHLSNYLGVGKELLQSELPTARYTLRYGILIRELSEADRRNLEVAQLVEMMVKALQDIWQRANALFKPPVTNDPRTIHLKLKTLWQKAFSFSLRKGKLTDKEMFTSKLD